MPMKYFRSLYLINTVFLMASSAYAQKDTTWYADSNFTKEKEGLTWFSDSLLTAWEALTLTLNNVPIEEINDGGCLKAILNTRLSVIFDVTGRYYVKRFSKQFGWSQEGRLREAKIRLSINLIVSDLLPALEKVHKMMKANSLKGKKEIYISEENNYVCIDAVRPYNENKGEFEVVCRLTFKNIKTAGVESSAYADRFREIVVYPNVCTVNLKEIDLKFLIKTLKVMHKATKGLETSIRSK